ncbi:MAG: hypothetical protein GKR95_15560 [Gammaproteobacteria bacterium]|nr:hypothetical protein [Gammaproteobacteria bacterium]
MPLYAFDGTWNDSRSPERDKLVDTNVFRFMTRYSGRSFYLDGVGARKGCIGKVLGGLTGAGSQVRVEENFNNLIESFANGETGIDIVGYSRGATIARMFVHKIASEFYKIKDRDNNRLIGPPTIRFLGLFDTVASLGVPWNEDEGNFVPTIPEFVERTYHAMALDEIRETFGIERCVGLRQNISEVWFRGGHADIGGNATYHTIMGERVANRERSNIALGWMICKAVCCGLPISDGDSPPKNIDALVTSALDKVPIGNAGTKSRRIHIGDLIHYSIDCELGTAGINGNILRRIDVPTRIEDETLESSAEILHWRPDIQGDIYATEPDSPKLIELSSRRYPFDISPARTWRAWLAKWGLDAEDFTARLNEFWAPTAADKALAWDIYIELQTRITTQKLPESEGDEQTALESVASLFSMLRNRIRVRGIDSANVATLLTVYLNKKIRPFTTKWHIPSKEGTLDASHDQSRSAEFRAELRKLQPKLNHLAQILSELADASLIGIGPRAYLEQTL